MATNVECIPLAKKEEGARVATGEMGPWRGWRGSLNLKVQVKSVHVFDQAVPKPWGMKCFGISVIRMCN